VALIHPVGGEFNPIDAALLHDLTVSDRLAAKSLTTPADAGDAVVYKSVCVIVCVYTRE
jgi:hypothetical protein